MTSLKVYDTEPLNAPPVEDEPFNNLPGQSDITTHSASPTPLEVDTPRAQPGESSRSVSFTATERGENAERSGGGTPPLENNAKQIRKRSISPGQLRKQRWLARMGLWSLSGIKRVRFCGKHSARPMGTVDVRSTPSEGAADRVGFSGLQSCASVWACPVCSAKIQATRREELKLLVTWAVAQGYAVAFGTVTLRHKKGQALADLWRAVSKCYTSVHNSARVSRLRKQLGVVGWVRALEVTHGDNGWHPHLHVMWIYENGPDVRDVPQKDGEDRRKWFERATAESKAAFQEKLEELADAEFSIWERQVVKHGLGKPLRDHYQLRMVSDASVEFSDYFAKGVYDPSVARSAKSMSYEMSGNMSKAGRSKGSRTPWQILEDMLSTGDADDLALWEEYELASKGKTALLWSNGLKALVGVGDKSDEEVAEEEIGSEEDVLFAIGDWAEARTFGAGILNAVEKGGKQGGLDFCAGNNIWVLEADDPDVEEDRHLYATRFDNPDDVD